MQKTAKACKDDKPESKPDAVVPDDNPDGTPTVQQLVQNAGDALKTGNYGQALRLCELALLDKPRNRKALSICAIASCNLKNRDKAEKYIGSLPRAMRDAPLHVCARQGIDLGKD